MLSVRGAVRSKRCEYGPLLTFCPYDADTVVADVMRTLLCCILRICILSPLMHVSFDITPILLSAILSGSSSDGRINIIAASYAFLGYLLTMFNALILARLLRHTLYTYKEADGLWTLSPPDEGIIRGPDNCGVIDSTMQDNSSTPCTCTLTWPSYSLVAKTTNSLHLWLRYRVSHSFPPSLART